jgi:hypothetical protein
MAAWLGPARCGLRASVLYDCPVTQRDAIHRLGPSPTVTQACVTGVEIVAGPKVPIDGVAGFAGGIAYSFMMRLVDAGLSIPYITVIIILSVIFRPNKAIRATPGSPWPRRSRGIGARALPAVPRMACFA